MLIHRLKAQRVLSFGIRGIDLELKALNVLIGPNGSGKSNFTELLALLQATPRDIEDFFAADGIDAWRWQGDSQGSMFLQGTVDYPEGGVLLHTLTLNVRGSRPWVEYEAIEPVGGLKAEKYVRSYYRPALSPEIDAEIAEHNEVAMRLNRERWAARLVDNAMHFAGDFQPRKSILSHHGIPNEPPLWRLSEAYNELRVFRTTSFGPASALRRPASTHDRSDFVNEQGTNLPLVLANFHGKTRQRFVESLQRIFDGVIDYACPVTTGTISLFLDEGHGRMIPASRLSDGTLRYLHLLAVLLHPTPPRLVVIDEPDLGLHPDLVASLADLLIEASGRTQLVVTTHSRVLVDALSDHIGCVVVCEREDGESRFERLDPKRLTPWLENYSLGELWSSGEIGGNRW